MYIIARAIVSIRCFSISKPFLHMFPYARMVISLMRKISRPILIVIMMIYEKNVHVAFFLTVISS